MKFFLNKVTACFLTLALLSTSAISAFAQASAPSEEKTNIHYEKGNLNDLFSSTGAKSGSTELIYTYVKNNETYRVYDEASGDLSHSFSGIYKIGKNNEEVLVRTETVDVQNGIITTIIIENRKKRLT